MTMYEAEVSSVSFEIVARGCCQVVSRSEVVAASSSDSNNQNSRPAESHTSADENKTIHDDKSVIHPSADPPSDSLTSKARDQSGPKCSCTLTVPSSTSTDEPAASKICTCTPGDKSEHANSDPKEERITSSAELSRTNKLVVNVTDSKMVIETSKSLPYDCSVRNFVSVVFFDVQRLDCNSIKNLCRRSFHAYMPIQRLHLASVGQN